MNPDAQPFGTPAAPAGPHPHLNLAGTLLAITGGLSILYALFRIASSALGGFVGGDPADVLRQVDPAMREQLGPLLAVLERGSTMMGVVWGLVMAGVSAFVVFGGLKLRSGQSYNLAMAAAVLATIPCCFNGCCCVISMPAGIFALILLTKPEVKASFTN